MCGQTSLTNKSYGATKAKAEVVLFCLFNFLFYLRERFEVHNGIIKKCISSPLFQELLTLKQVSYKNSESEKPNENKGNSEVIRYDTLGGYRELNPDRELHKLACYRYTIATIILGYFYTKNHFFPAQKKIK